MSDFQPSVASSICSHWTPTNFIQCRHCLLLFCSECLMIHLCVDLQSYLIDLVKRIDAILARFLHHAHNQTEWTDHLTQDRHRLQFYIDILRKISSKSHVHVCALPGYQWLIHVDKLIRKNSIAIEDKCCFLSELKSTSVSA